MLRKKLAKLLYPELEIKKVTDLEIELNRYKKIYKVIDEFNIDIHRFIAERDYLNELEPEERREILGLASGINKNKAFELVVNGMMNIMASHSIIQAPDSKIAQFDRAGINAYQLLKDEFRRLDGLYTDETSPEEEYDKNEIL